MNKIDLNNRVAIVTGGAQGFGYSMVQRFSESGATVIIWDKDKNLMESLSLPKDIHTMEVDITTYEDVENATNQVLKKFNSIDILVNNAGIAGPSFKTWEYPLQDWKNVIDIDLSGTFYCSKAIVPHMIKADYGRIVNISSIAGKEGNPNACAYSSSKSAVIGLTKSLGKELALEDIAVNCVTPAVARTKIIEQQTKEFTDYILSKIPRNRMAEITELASMVTWLASEENSFSTAAVFDLSGGRATY